MKAGSRLKTLIPTVFGFVILILDSKTALAGAMGGLDICLRAVIPSLFPFIFLSSVLTSSILSAPLGSSSAVCRLFRLPMGGGRILLIGLLGGYPVGARCIGEAVAKGKLSQKDGKRMLVFCNAAGPAFIFGITGCLFSQRWVPWCLWGIQVFSAFCMARLLPFPQESSLSENKTAGFSLTQNLSQSLRVMAEICGWIILMRVIIAMLQKWILWLLPQECQILLTGLLELANGCIALQAVTNSGLRFILCSVFLGFGGLCVALQTASAAAGVNQNGYLPGKLQQGLICFLTSYSMQHFIFEKHERASIPWLLLVASLILLGIFNIFTIKLKKSSGKKERIGV